MTNETMASSSNNMEVHGVRLKHFERVVAFLLTTTTNEKNTDDNNHELAVKGSFHDGGASSTTRRSPLRPEFVQLPPLVVEASNETTVPTTTATTTDDDDDMINNNNNWPWYQLPPAARVYGPLPGQLSDDLRASRKEDQIRSMLRCILPLLDNAKTGSSSSCRTSSRPTSSSIFTIVDFGGGSGHLAIPLALLRPSCRIVCVDLGEQSLELLHQKAAHCCCGTSETAVHDDDDKGKRDTMDELPSLLTTMMNDNNNNTDEEVNDDDDPRWRRTAIPNLWTFHGPAQAYNSGPGSNNNNHHGYPLDMAVALHMCGEATDVVLRLAGERGAVAIVAAPCCVGKLQRNTPTTSTISSGKKKKNGGNRNPYIFQATGQNQPTVQYPQSKAFRERLAQQQCDWDALARAADYSDVTECRTARNAARRTAKALLEMDRCLFLRDHYNYHTVLTRMLPWEASPKNDILVAWRRPTSRSNATALEEPPAPPSILDSPVDLECQADIQLTMEHLMLSSKQVADSDSGGIQNDTVDWTRDEMDNMRRQLTEFLDGTRNDPTATMIFPTGMGGRQRKLVHYTAAQMNLAHWGQGSKQADKTVLVRRKWHKPLQQQQPTITTCATGDK